MRYRLAFKIGGEWCVLGPAYESQQDAVRCRDHNRARNPNRECIVITLVDDSDEQLPPR